MLNMKYQLPEKDGQKAERWCLNLFFIPGEARMGNLFEALSEKNKALDESVWWVKVSLCVLGVLCVTIKILCHRAITARTTVRNTTTSPAIMGNSGNLKVLSTNEDNGKDDSTAKVLITRCADDGPFGTKFWLYKRRLCELTCYCDMKCLGVPSIGGMSRWTLIRAFVQAFYHFAVGQPGVKPIGGFQQTHGFQIHFCAIKLPWNGLDRWVGPDVTPQHQLCIYFYCNFLWPRKLRAIWGRWGRDHRDHTAVTHNCLVLISTKWDQLYSSESFNNEAVDLVLTNAPCTEHSIYPLVGSCSKAIIPPSPSCFDPIISTPKLFQTCWNNAKNVKGCCMLLQLTWLAQVGHNLSFCFIFMQG